MAERPESDQLVTRLRDGDDTAFVAFYTDFHPRLLRYARSLVAQDAEDVVAEAWLQIVRDVRRFHGTEDDLRGWTTRIVRNRALDFARARGRRPEQSVGLDLVTEHPGGEDTAGAALESISTGAAIELICTLPRDQAEAVLLRAVVGLDAASAGAVVGKSAGAIRVSAHRGLRRLRRTVAER